MASKTKTKINGTSKTAKNQPESRHVANGYESSDDEEPIEQKVFDGVFRNLDNNSYKESIESLTNAFLCGSVCLICISKIKRADRIWSCTNCYNFFHLNCIQRWGNDSVLQKKRFKETDEGYYNSAGQYIPKDESPLEWNCPKCRESYASSEIPRDYFCFCAKQIEPEYQEWILPHSCGNVCMKKLGCQHKCLLLCHPASCPPCPQTITVSCECGKSPLKTIRCFEKKWNCFKPCGKKLECGHFCEDLCHETCPPCTKTRVQTCSCGSKTEKLPCFKGTLKCTKICDKNYSCGVHKCKKICCDGNCGPCSVGLSMTCPCGKQKFTGSCENSKISCEDTCEKVLDCGSHKCISQCHAGPCPECQIIVPKACRCGLFTKEIACSKAFFCETKCKRLRTCKKHACNKKCCPNDDHETICEKPCGKLLSCGKHKCTSLCGHLGPCYPCNKQSEIKCKCGSTTKLIMCGREKKSKPPKCRQPCTVKSKCRHQNKHFCHFGECPPCDEMCNEALPCSHSCKAKCHDFVKVSIKEANFKPSMPGEYAVERVEFKKLDHPKCQAKVPVGCIGGHETALWPCWNSKPTSCGRPCGRKLSCSNHKCDKECHSVKDVNMWEQDENCAKCDRGCEKKRPDGCTHPCNQSCHVNECKPCIATIKAKCHCGLSLLVFKCSDFNMDLDENSMQQKRQKILSCGNRCPKNYDCGHQCTSDCHEGECPNADSCKKKKKMYCKCKNRKADISCEKIRAGFKLKCDESCDEKRKLESKERELEELREKEKKELEFQKELESYKKIFEKKQHKKKAKNVVEEEKKTFDTKMIILIIFIILTIVLISLYLYLY
ncbi:NF-X1-type zinc finger protein NFXL1-like [Culicoides brevitarsis]|uniref:NF-X1-type zinc finger protein NFXL1-like n=1 Tax=Culicoides brevitarsis TaxID=469753 RepID=UPI00307C548C